MIVVLKNLGDWESAHSAKLSTKSRSSGENEVPVSFRAGEEETVKIYRRSLRIT